jgi:hypothetical protein
MKSTKKIILVLSISALALLIYSFTDQSQAVPDPKADSIQVEDKVEIPTQTVEFDPSYKIGSPELPSSLTFAGEVVPVARPEVREKLDREMLVNMYWQSSTILLIKRSKRIFDIIDPILKEQGVPADFKYLAVAESGLIENAVSSSGARGIWQFMKTTGKKYGLESTTTVEERYNTELATRAACKYLKKAYKATGSWALAAAAYNRGEAGILRDMKKQRANSYYDLYLNRETGRYLYRIIALKTILENPSTYGFSIPSNEYYTSPNTYKVTVDTTIADLPAYALKQGTTYMALRTLNPWLISYSLANKSRKKYVIRLPYLEAEEGME